MDEEIENEIELHQFYDNFHRRALLKESSNGCNIELILETRKVFGGKTIPCISAHLKEDLWYTTFLDGKDGYTFATALKDETIMDLYHISADDLEIAKSAFLIKEMNISGCQKA